MLLLIVGVEMMRHVLDKNDLFRRLVVSALRQFCSDCKINNHPIIAIDGRLLVTVNTGEIFELAVHEINVGNVGGDVLRGIRDIKQHISASQISTSGDVRVLFFYGLNHLDHW
jgi:hypothetical protein